MHIVKTLLNNRFLCEFLDTTSKENAIFCSPLSEDLYNICDIQFKGGELISDLIIENTQKYVVADVMLEDGRCYKNVKFRVEVCDKEDLPRSIINLKLLESASPVAILKTDKSSEQQPKQEEILLEQCKDDLIEDVLDIEQEIVKIQERRKREKIKLNESNTQLENKILKTNEQLMKALDVYKNELTNEYFKIKSLYDENKILLEKNVDNISLEKERFLTESLQEQLSVVKNKISELITERKAIDDTVNSIKKYADDRIAQSTQSAKDFARRILDLGSGGGSVAQQFANGGTMKGTLNVTGQYLSAGTDLFDIFLTSETDSQTLSYNDQGSLSISNGNNVTLSSFDTVDATNKLLSAGTDLFDIFLTSETDSQTLSYNENNSQLTITSGNTVSLSSLVTTQNFNSYQTNVANTTATLLPTSIYQNTSGNFIQQNGNSLGTKITIGTNDNNNLVFETNGQNRLVITNTGNISGNNQTVSFNQGSATGNYSFAVNGGSASGDYSHAEGNGALASGTGSHAEGNGTEAYGTYSHAEGFSSTASGNYSHAEGDQTTASGSASHAEGYNTNALGQQSHAEGNQTTASGDYSHAEGNQTSAFGAYSHAEGDLTSAFGAYSHTEGRQTQTTGSASHAEGHATIASGSQGHAEGYNTKAYGQQSHAEGYQTVAVGNISHAAGFRATAAQHYTYAWSDGNLRTNTTNVSTTRSGQYMVSASGGMFIPGNVGIGTDSIANALTVAGTVSSNKLATVGNIKIEQADTQTFTTEVTANGNFLIININGQNKAIRLWDY